MNQEQDREEKVAKILKSDSYQKAYRDERFLHSDDARELRLLSEYIKPESYLRRYNVLSTVIVFGSARIISPDDAQKKLAEAEARLAREPGSDKARHDVSVAKEKVALSGYYEKARRFAELVSERQTEIGPDGKRRFDADAARKYVICTGGGPGIMEAANRGAHDAGGISIGLNISLPFEQQPNPFITPDLCFQFHYFALRKLHFMLRAVALVAFPGGFGTFDELFEGLTLRQTKKMQRLPIILFGEEFWRKSIHFEHLAETGVISPEDLELFKFVETPDEAIDAILDFYGKTRENI